MSPVKRKTLLATIAMVIGMGLTAHFMFETPLGKVLFALAYAIPNIYVYGFVRCANCKRRLSTVCRPWRAVMYVWATDMKCENCGHRF